MVAIYKWECPYNSNMLLLQNVCTQLKQNIVHVAYAVNMSVKFVL